MTQMLLMAKKKHLRILPRNIYGHTDAGPTILRLKVTVEYQKLKYTIESPGSLANLICWFSCNTRVIVDANLPVPMSIVVIKTQN